MKHILPLLIALLLTMTGCHRPATTGELCTELQQAEALMYPHPDSALHILQTMDVPGDELNRATWALFTTQAKYKLYQTQSDSLINIALPYFLKTEDTQRRALALYYRAALYNEEKKVEEAQDFYLKAAEEVEKTEDYQLGHLIYAGLWNVYGYRNLNDYALEAAQKTLEYAKKANNYKAQISAYNYIARTYTLIKKYDDVVISYKKGLAIAEEIGDCRQQKGITSELAAIYNSQKDYKSALFYIRKALDAISQCGDKNSGPTYLTAGMICANLNQSDSAIFYYEKAVLSSNLYTQIAAHLNLYRLLNKHNNKDASYHVETAWALNDSITKLDKSRTLIEMQEKYDQQKVKDEAAMEIRLQKQRTQTTIGIIIVVVLLAGVYARHRYRQRIARLAEAEDRIDTLTRMLEEAQASTDKEDAFVKRMLLQQLGVIRLVASTPTAQNQALLRRLAELGNDQVPVEELIVWEDLYPLIDRLYNRFHTRLKERYGSLLTDKEIQTCCLLCAGFSTKEIGVITHQSASSIYVRKTAIRKKLGAEEGADIVEVIKKK